MGGVRARPSNFWALAEAARASVASPSKPCFKVEAREPDGVLSDRFINVVSG